MRQSGECTDKYYAMCEVLETVSTNIDILKMLTYDDIYEMSMNAYSYYSTDCL